MRVSVYNLSKVISELDIKLFSDDNCLFGEMTEIDNQEYSKLIHGFINFFRKSGISDLNMVDFYVSEEREGFSKLIYDYNINSYMFLNYKEKGGLK